MSWLVALLTLTAQAEMPLPSFREELARATWYRVNAVLEEGCRFEPAQAAVVCEDGTTARAIELAEDFQETVFADAGLEYLVGLSWRYAGQDDRAVLHYQRALELDPDEDAAWYDLGEIWLTRGELEQAASAFEQVARLRAEGPNAWLGPWRRAEVAAHQRDPDVFEEHMREALRRGFTFRQVQGLENWKGFYADPVMRDSIEKLITVYSTRDVLDSLRPPAPTESAAPSTP